MGEENVCIITMFRAQDWKWVSQFPEEIHEGKPNHTSKEKPLSMHYKHSRNIRKKKAFLICGYFNIQLLSCTYTGVYC